MSTQPLFRNNESPLFEETVVGPMPGMKSSSLTTKGLVVLMGLSIPTVPVCALGGLYESEIPFYSWPLALLITSWTPAILFSTYLGCSNFNSRERKFENCSKYTFGLSLYTITCATICTILFANIVSNQTDTATTTSYFY